MSFIKKQEVLSCAHAASTWVSLDAAQLCLRTRPHGLLAQVFTVKLNKHSLQPKHLELPLIMFHKLSGFESGHYIDERSLDEIALC